MHFCSVGFDGLFHCCSLLFFIIILLSLKCFILKCHIFVCVCVWLSMPVNTKQSSLLQAEVFFRIAQRNVDPVTFSPLMFLLFLFFGVDLFWVFYSVGVVTFRWTLNGAYEREFVTTNNLKEVLKAKAAERRACRRLEYSSRTELGDVQHDLQASVDDSKKSLNFKKQTLCRRVYLFSKV